MTNPTTSRADTPPPRGLLGWLRVFGPGAVVASLSIGTGELIFSTRGGAIFGYRILLAFVVISILKWALVVAAARHFVITGVHPYRRMLELPGPRGWLPLILFLIALVCLPIWISFFPGVLGNLVSTVTNTQDRLGGAIDYAYGAAILAGLLVLIATSGYSALERVQLTFVTVMLACAAIALVAQNPDWLEMLRGFLVPQELAYPSWLGDRYPDIARQPVWVETTRYVGVIGGASFDYMAYTTWLREKGWGRAGKEPASQTELEASATNKSDTARLWAKAAAVDCGLSFLLVVAFSAVFVASGVLLAEEQTLPTSDNFLAHQARFFESLHPSLSAVYLVGAFLTILGTLYGTIEVGCAIAEEMAHTWCPEIARRNRRRIRRWSITWCALGAYVILAWLTAYQLATSEANSKPPLLLMILTPANLFTGVLGCGILCAVNCWMDRRFLPRALRMGKVLFLLNALAAPTFLFLGLKGYWEHESRAYALTGLCILLTLGFSSAAIVARKRGQRSSND